jgi:hypothetical protein
MESRSEDDLAGKCALWGLLVLAGAFLVMGLFCGVASADENEGWETNICPVVYPECLHTDVMWELEHAYMLDPSVRPLRDYEQEAIRITTSRGRTLVDFTSISRHGFAHFTPPNGLNVPALEEFRPVEGECINTDWHTNREWRNALNEVLYSPYAAVIQLQEWRRETGPGIAYARQQGWSGEQLAVAAVLCNGIGSRGFRELTAEYGHDPEATIAGYLAANPTRHARLRSRQLNGLLDR